MKKILILLCTISLFGCKKYLDVNENLNTSTSARVDYILTNALATTAANQVGGLLITPGSWVGYYGHSTSFSGGGTEKTYSFSNTDFNFYDGLYDNIADYQYVIQNGVKDSLPQWVGPAMVMRAYVYQQLVDLYGDVPYTEALQGINVITPKFTDDQAVYEDLIKQIDAAVVQMKSITWKTATGVSGADVMFAANKTKWIQFANTLKMRILMRQSMIAGRDSYITTEINKIVAEGSGFIAADVFIQPGYQKTAGKLNPFYNNYGFSEVDAQRSGFAYRKVSSPIINFLKTTNDLFRLQKIAYPAGTANLTPSNNFADYVGIPLGGQGQSYLEGATSSIGPMQIQKGDAARPSIFFTLAERWFLQAEAVQRYAIPALGTAQAAYSEGVKADFRLKTAYQTFTPNATVAQADAASTAYLANGVKFSDWTLAVASDEKIRTILIQKWVSLIHVNGLEAWSEYRKTSGNSAQLSVPGSVKSVAPNTPNEPVRLFYPFREESVNGSNVPQKIDVFTSKIFWDIN